MHRPAAVDHDGLARDEGGGVAGEEGDQVPDVLRGATALEGLLLQYAAVERLLVGVDPLCVGREGAGEMALTVIPSGPTSRASVRVKPMMAPLEET